MSSALIVEQPGDWSCLMRTAAHLFAEHFRPSPRLPADEWIEEHCYLSSETSAMPGRYRFAKFEPWRAVARAFSNPHVREIIVSKPSQVGYTELLLRLLAFCMAADPSSILLVHTTLDDAKLFTKKRIKPMIRDTPKLREILPEATGRREADETLTYLGFPGGSLTQVGSNSASGVSSNPVRRVFCEEVGRWKRNASGEGDTYKLADARTRTFFNRMKFAGSSPAEEGTCRVTELLADTNGQTWHVPCVGCGEFFRLEWRNADGEYMLRCDKSDTGEWLYDTAYYPCPHCGTPHTEREKRDIVARGKWVASRPDITDKLGFQVDGLLSPWMPWPDVLREFDAAKGSMDTLKTFVNTVIGLPFAPPHERINADSLMARAEPMPEFPPWVGAFTIGMDLQADRYELLPVGWGAGERCAVLPPVRVFGRIDDAETQRDALARILEPRSGMTPAAVCIDTGYRPELAWQLVDALRARGVYAYGVKGMEDGPIIREPSSQGRKTARNPYLVGSNAVKDSIEARFRADPEGPKGVAFSDGIDAESFAQLTAEEKRLTMVSGRPRKVWRLRPGMRNEMLDMLGYAIAALHARGVRLIITLQQLADSRTAPQVQAETPPETPKPDPVLAALMRSRRPAAPSRGFLKSGRR